MPQFMAATGQVFRMGRLPTEHSRVRYWEHGYPGASQTLMNHIAIKKLYRKESDPTDWQNSADQTDEKVRDPLSVRRCFATLP